MKRLLLLVVAVAAVSLMVGSGTMAYFTASATSAGNSFSAGHLDFVIKSPTGAAGQAVFNVPNMKPGQEVDGIIAVANDSSTGMNQKWRAHINGSGALYSALKVKVILNPTGTSAPTDYILAGPSNFQIFDWTPFSALLDPNTTPLRWVKGVNTLDDFEPGWYSAYKLIVKMDEAAGNSYQNTSFTGNIIFNATQAENTGW